jgi:acetoin utilization deacetylase AcuC-like enzyme
VIPFSTSCAYEIPLPKGHPFPMDKYNGVQGQLLYEGLIEESQLIQAPLLKASEALEVHSATYWRQVMDCDFSAQETRKIGFPASDALRDRSLSSAGGTLWCAHQALVHGVAINLAGGTHHAFRDKGEGYCVLNDLAIAAACLLAARKVQKVLIVDLDVHQGNGTAEIFAGDDRVFTFSMHGKDNYPLRKSFSDMDIALPTGTTDAVYLGHLHSVLPALLRKVKPDIIFYQSGVDVLEGDRLGKLALTMEGLGLRDAFVFSQAKAADIPIVSVMGGGYQETLPALIAAHTQTIKKALDIYV